MRISGRKTTGMIAIALALTTLCGAVCGAYNNSVHAAATSRTESEPTTPTVATSVKASDSLAASGKDETVYVMAGADGAVKKIIVSTWLKNNGADQISDETCLQNIENIGGNETYALNGDDMVIWDAQGNDIRYQGTTDKELPVSMNVTYELDGKPIAAEDLAGKSGAVTMRFSYVNNQYETVAVNGKQENIYVPFVMLTGMMLDNDCCSNVEVSNGKMINDGDRTYVIGFALPGMNHNLNISSEQLKLPESVEVTFDATNFSLGTTVTLASNSLFNNTDAEKTSSADNLLDAVPQLCDAMTSLTNGSSDLYDGLCLLLDKSGELSDGVDKLKQSLPQIEALKDGSADLNGGLQSLSKNSGTLVDGAGQTFASLLSMADSQLAAAGVTAPKLTMDNYASVLNGLGASMSDTDAYNIAYNTALSAVTAAVRQQESVIRSQVELAVRSQVLEAVLAGAGITCPDGSAMTATQYDQSVAAGVIDPAVAAQVTAAVDMQMQSEQIQSTIKTNTENQIQSAITTQMASATVQSRIEAGKQAALAGAGSLNKLKSGLDSYSTFYQGLKAYTGGVDSAASGSAKIASGMATLYQQLDVGFNSLQTGTDALKDGVSQLKDGSLQLSDGIKELDEQGIQKIADAFGGDPEDLSARIHATIEVSRHYTSFSGTEGSADGSVKFIYRTDSIG